MAALETSAVVARSVKRVYIAIAAVVAVPEARAWLKLPHGRVVSCGVSIFLVNCEEFGFGVIERSCYPIGFH